MRYKYKFNRLKTRFLDFKKPTSTLLIQKTQTIHIIFL